MYKAYYLPLALDDLKEIIRYIAQKKENKYLFSKEPNSHFNRLIYRAGKNC